jgi:acetyl esterase/lipase
MVHKPMIEQMAKTYLGEGNVRDPLAAPLYGDLRGLPPLLIQVGSRETLLDDAVRIADKAKKAGVEVELDVWKGQIHVWQIFASRLDEGEKAIQKIGGFVHKRMG